MIAEDTQEIQPQGTPWRSASIDCHQRRDSPSCEEGPTTLECCGYLAFATVLADASAARFSTDWIRSRRGAG